MIGALLNNRYRLEVELGRGGMGVVYRAHDTLLDRPVAIKVVTASTLLGTEGRTRLLREAQSIARLNHPNIISIYDAGETDRTPFIVMELLEGESLHNLQARQPQSLESILTIVQQVCAALDHAHAHGIIHRDLKPENVWITSGGLVKLMDFGLARPAASRLTVEGTVVGTALYFAPEQATGKEVDSRADLYALGVMLYELTTGQVPFSGNDLLALIAQHVHTQPVPPRQRNPAIPAALEALILRLLSKQPEDRPASAAEVLRALQQLELPDSSRTGSQVGALHLERIDTAPGAAPAERITVFMVDDHAVVRQGLRFYLSACPDIAIVGEAGDVQSAVKGVADLVPDVVLMDLALPLRAGGEPDEQGGVQATRQVRQVSPHTRVVVLTSFAHDDLIFAAIRAGALSYLLKDADAETVLGTIRAASRGESTLHPRIAQRLMAEVVSPRPASEPAADLTERELQVLQLIAQGLSNAEIAARLVITERTVKAHVGNLLGKLHLSDRTQAAVYAWREGLVKGPT